MTINMKVKIHIKIKITENKTTMKIQHIQLDIKKGMEISIKD